MSESLKPCPFCGHRSIVERRIVGWRARCDDVEYCDARGPYGFTSAIAIARWNAARERRAA